MVVNSIGPFTFINLHGEADFLVQSVEVLTRPGVDDAGFKLSGLHPKPFQLQSVVDAANVADAQFASGRYTFTVGSVVNLIKNDVNFGSFGIMFVVLDVKTEDIRALGYGQGGLFPPSRALISATWTLCPIRIQAGTN